MALDAADLAKIREYVGGSLDDDALGDAWETWAAWPYATRPQRVALAVLRQRQADMASGPQRWQAVGDYSEDWGDGARLSSLIAQLEAACGLGSVTTGRLVRPHGR